MAFTLSDLERIEDAIRQNVLQVTFADGREVRFSSFDELVNRWHFIARSLNVEAGRQRLFTEFRKGVVP